MEALQSPPVNRTLCDLPNELLLEIIVHVDHRPSVKTCALVCRCLRAVCQRLLFENTTSLRVSEAKSFDLFLAFIDANHEIAQNVTELALRGKNNMTMPSVDMALVVRVIEGLPRLQHLSFQWVRFSSEVPAFQEVQSSYQDSGAADPRPPLRTLGMDSFGSHQSSSLTVISRIASLFDIDSLALGPFDIETVPTPGTALALLQVRELDLTRWFPTVKHRVQLYDALTTHLLPDYLQRLKIQFGCRDTLIAVGRLLSGPGRCVRELNLESSRAPPSSEERNEWVDPLDEHWKSLNLSQCAHLEFLTIRITVRKTSGPVPSCTTLVQLMSQVSKTLKTLKLIVSFIDRPGPSSYRRLRKLKAVDKALSNSSAFPCFKRLKVDWTYHANRADSRAVLIAALPQLHAARKLKLEK